MLWGSQAESVLDRVATVQLNVAWAGEGRCEPGRLGWWATDLVDEDGGGDFFRRLAPRTHRWAALQAAREAACWIESARRKGAAEPDRLVSLFHLGADVDQWLDERLGDLKRSGARPEKALPDLMDFDEPFDPGFLGDWLRHRGQVEFEVGPLGRQVRGPMPGSLERAVDKLAAALVPLGEQYPVPHFRVKG